MFFYFDYALLLHTVLCHAAFRLLDCLLKRTEHGRRQWLALLFSALVRTVMTYAWFLGVGGVWLAIFDICAEGVLLCYYYAPRSVSDFLRVAVGFLFTQCLIGGVFLWLMQYPKGNRLFDAARKNIVWFCALYIVCCFVLRIVFRFLSETIKESRQSVDITVSFLGKELHAFAYRDSGNFLRDPRSGKPVSLGCYQHFEQWLPKEYRELLEYCFREQMLPYAEMEKLHIKNLYLIPCKTVGEERRIPMIIIDRLSYSRNGEPFVRENVCLGFTNSMERLGGIYDVLLHNQF